MENTLEISLRYLGNLHQKFNQTLLSEGIQIPSLIFNSAKGECLKIFKENKEAIKRKDLNIIYIKALNEEKSFVNLHISQKLFKDLDKISEDLIQSDAFQSCKEYGINVDELESKLLKNLLITNQQYTDILCENLFINVYFDVENGEIRVKEFYNQFVDELSESLVKNLDTYGWEKISYSNFDYISGLTSIPSVNYDSIKSFSVEIGNLNENKIRFVAKNASILYEKKSESKTLKNQKDFSELMREKTALRIEQVLKSKISPKELANDFGVVYIKNIGFAPIKLNKKVVITYKGIYDLENKKFIYTKKSDETVENYLKSILSKNTLGLTPDMKKKLIPFMCLLDNHRRNV